MKRNSPERLLKAIKRDENSSSGKLKIFFGYAAGVGKTYAMLEAARALKESGVDVVVGYIEPHDRPKTLELAKGLPSIPPKMYREGSIDVLEFDIDAALSRRPELILVDELAHTNAKGARHAKRYQDIEELLRAGIDVYTTVNVQHIESLNDKVASITGVSVKERIPDSVFDEAYQVELVDIEPEDLLIRLREGLVYKREQAERAQKNFFTIENLNALREIALRRQADRVNILTESERIKGSRFYSADEHILVCLSSAPSNSKIVRTGARMAYAFKGKFTALFVETPTFDETSDDDKKRLTENARLAEQLGATIETVYGEDVAYQIAEYARLSGISKIVLGRSSTKRKLFGKPTITERLTEIAPNIDIYVIPDSKSLNYSNRKKKVMNFSFSIADFFISLLILVVATFIGFIFKRLGFTEANIITIYILGVLINSIVTRTRVYSLVSSVVSVLLFNFFFTDPLYTFAATDKGYPVTFVIMFLSAFLTGTLAVKLKNQAKESAKSAFRTKVLFDTNQLLQKAGDEEEILEVTASQLIKLLDRDIVIYPAKGETLGDAICHTAHATRDELLNEKEKTVAEWVLKNNKHAGASTGTLEGAKCLYLSIRLNEKVYAVVGINLGKDRLDSFEKSVVLSIIEEAALALENNFNIVKRQEAAILAKNEQLRANLLRAISHDLRTPLTSISGNASNLLYNSKSFTDDMKNQIYTDIYDDSMWLINLVENLLSVTRIDEGRMNLNMSTELMEEVIDEALRHINRKSVLHKIEVKMEEEFVLAKIDAKLIVQVLINIIDNAIKYTDEGSTITISTKSEGKFIKVEIADDGPGIPDEVKPRVFDMFYSGANKIVDSRRSLGLGLSLCKSIINAHGGTITLRDNKPKGTVFSFTLPAGEVKMHE